MLGFGSKKQRPIDTEYPEYIGKQNAVQGGVQPSSTAQSENPAVSQQDLDNYINQRNAEIDAQVTEFSRKTPGFDIRREIQNPDFCTYVWSNGLSVEDAYYLVHRNDMSQKAQNTEKRITENGTAKPGGSGMLKKNPSEMSDEEIDDIIKRVRNGEKISF